MDNDQPVQTQQEAVNQNAMPSGVSFPTVGQPKKSGGAKTLLIVGILVLVAILGFVIFKSATKVDETLAEPTPFDNLTTSNVDSTPIESSTPVATATPKPADKAKVTIEIQNGTGITGEAAYLQSQLKALGYTNLSVGNASSQNLTATEVTFSKALASSFVDEITTKLKSIYTSVTVKTSATQTGDAVIITGLRKNATPKASSTPVASASSTPTASPTPTAN
ncbi:MAG TPA: LytR C-terminal domain-containing protein [Patescibacteria group bacterium]|nr:LytR C-terminal domain-containing protein [Patescibacteria group bacterium]